MSKKITPHTDQLLNVHEAAAFLGVNPGTIRRWAQSKTITGLKVGTRGDWRFTRDHVVSLAREDVPDSNMVMSENVPSADWESIESSGHFAQFYETDVFLVNSLKDFIMRGIRKGDTCILIVSDSHRREIFSRMIPSEMTLFEAAVQDETCIILDTQETLSHIMAGTMPDRQRFTNIIGNLITRSQERGRHVRAFGEMVSLLWCDGNEEAVQSLEEMWNELHKTHAFSLICAYPLSRFGNNKYCDQFAAIGEKHTGVLPAESYSNLTNVRDRLSLITKLQQKAEALESEVHERRKLEKQKDEFIGIASHELKTPVTSIKAYAQILQRRFEQKGDEESARYLQKMDIQLSRLTNLIHDLLDVTKIEAGQLQFNQRFFDLNELVDEVVETMNLTTGTHVIEKNLACNGSVYGDRDRIGQVLMNLLSNAIKYSPKAEKIIVKTFPLSEGMAVSVQDFGSGIRKQDQPYIFDRFFRAGDDYIDTYPGMGLGLYIAAQIMKRHEGNVWVESEKGKGSTFFISLPLNRASSS